MPTLSRELRNLLEQTCIDARGVAEEAARAALESMAVQHPEAYAHMTRTQKDLRNKLRARGRQLGDVQDAKDNLTLYHLAQECGYEHWHRMLFARFLAENSLLIPPDLGTPITLDECKELAKEEKTNLWALAGRYAQTMLPEIFRADDPVLQVPLAREDQLKLEGMLDALPADAFTASDSLGWCYQFWQSQRKKEVNESGDKIGADELPSVTQLFTEDYMVDFLLDNTLGAWWAGKVLTAKDAKGREGEKAEEQLRQVVALPGCPWKYLRFVKDDKAGWRPAAGTFEGWPKTANELKCLDPCMGSGHFVVAMFDRLVAMRIAEEKLGEKDAVLAVIRDNLFGLEIDPRCTQIAAFNLALAAWRRVGHCALPEMNLACSGLAPNTRETDWLAIAGDNQKLQRGMERLYRLFQKAVVLGSLINPRAGEDDLLVASFHELQPLLEKALAQKTKDETEHEMAVTARGLAKAAEILAGQFTLVATNVPYLGYKKQEETLKEFCERVHPDSKHDLATCLAERCVTFSAKGGSVALVTPHNWLFLGAYLKIRRRLLKEVQWDFVACLGPRGFQTPMYDFSVVLLSLTNQNPVEKHQFMGIDVADKPTPTEKASFLCCESSVQFSQKEQTNNPDGRVALTEPSKLPILGKSVKCLTGILNGDSPKFQKFFWEFESRPSEWAFQQSTVGATIPFGGREQLVFFDVPNGHLREDATIRRERLHDSDQRGNSVWGKCGLLVHRMGSLPVTLYTGDIFDQNGAVIVPSNESLLTAIWCFVSSDDYVKTVRLLDNKVGVTPATLSKVPFDLAHWQKVAAEKYPHGLPKPFSFDPSQWLFSGHPKDSDNPLHVAVARLLGYQWPRQTGSSFPDCPALKSDGLEKLADADGIVCIPSVRGEDSAADRLRKLLAAAYGKEWKPSSERELIAATGSKADDFDEWLRNDFFEQHCELFHQRPFLWHIWDGRKRDGFHVIVNYHKLSESETVSTTKPFDKELRAYRGTKTSEGGSHKGRKLLESLTHSYLGEWITRQKDGVKRGEAGAEDRLVAAQELKTRLEAIIEGEADPAKGTGFDIFVRWKPLSKQAIGWEPDINDGVRMNIRPFVASDLPGGKKDAGILRVRPKIKWEKDRGKEPQRDKKEFPWFWAGGDFTGDRVNDVHLGIEEKRKARE